MSALPIGIYLTLESETCCTCGVVFGLESGFRKQMIEKGPGKTFHCPNGHPQHYTGSSEIEKLKKQIQFEKDAAEWARKGRDLAYRRASALKGQITKIKKRVGNGVCPCCNRTFLNLQRHMECKHPKYKK